MRGGFMGTRRLPQGMEVRKKGSGGAGYAAIIPAGSTSWTAPASGKFKFHLWSAGFGGISGQGGCSGSYAEKTKNLIKGQVLPVAVGYGRCPAAGGNSSDTSVTFPDGTVVLANGPTVPTDVVTATGGDVNLGNSQGAATTGGLPGATGLGTGGALGGPGDNSTIGGGGGAPAMLPMIGGRHIAGEKRGGTPGGGGRGEDGAGGATYGGDGLVIVVRAA